MSEPKSFDMNVAEITSVLAVVGGLFSVANQLSKVLKAAYRLASTVEKVEDTLSAINQKLIAIDRTVNDHHQDIVDLRIETERLTTTVKMIEAIMIRNGYIPISDTK